MKLDFNRDQLLQLMKDFYTLTGIRIVLFDDEYQELLSWPEDDCAFCSRMKAGPATGALCRESDAHSFRQCQTDRQLIVYHCHAGLIEASIPLIDNHIVIGYLMFGQISDCACRDDLEAMLRAKMESYSFPADLPDLSDGIPCKTGEQIRAAAKIMEACTFYALYSETIALRRQHFTNNLRAFLMEHLQEPLDVQTVASHLGVSRSKLYLACDKYLGMGIAEYIRTLRIERARELLRSSDRSVTQIADDVGFDDYNYFCRVFKKETGYSAKKYRSLFQEK